MSRQGQELANRVAFGVFPLSGWWKENRGHQPCDRSARYALSASVLAPEAEVDFVYDHRQTGWYCGSGIISQTLDQMVFSASPARAMRRLSLSLRIAEMENDMAKERPNDSDKTPAVDTSGFSAFDGA